MSETIRPGKDERRTAILAIARAAFLQDGYAATSMSQIAATLGGSKATLYNYFPSKKDLFFAVVEVESTQALSHLYDMPADGWKNDDMAAYVHDALIGFCRRFTTTILSDDLIAFQRMVVAESQRFPEVGQAMYELGYKPGVERLSTLIQGGIDSGIFRPCDTRQAANFLLSLSCGHLHDLKTWNIGIPIANADIESHIAHTANAFLILYGNAEIAAAARHRAEL